MERYNYTEAIKADIRNYIEENLTPEEKHNLITNREINEDDLYSCLWADDSVTGNASGSYYCSTWKAEEAIAHNLDILADALGEFGCEAINPLTKGAEYCDVTIRCYLLGECLSEVLDELEGEMKQC